jgi:hypothetical protein
MLYINTRVFEIASTLIAVEQLISKIFFPSTEIGDGLLNLSWYKAVKKDFNKS